MEATQRARLKVSSMDISCWGRSHDFCAKRFDVTFKYKLHELVEQGRKN